MFNDSREFKKALILILFFQLLFLMIISLPGCGGSKNIPPAKILNTDEAMMAWDDVPDATSYNIYWSNEPGVTKKNGTKISDVRSPYKMKGLKKEKKYYFVVTAISDTGESRESEEISCIVGQ